MMLRCFVVLFKVLFFQNASSFQCRGGLKPFSVMKKVVFVSCKRLNELQQSSFPDEMNLPDNDEEDDLLSISENLGIDIGKEMNLSEEDKELIKREGTELIEGAFEEGLKELETMRSRMKKDFEKNKETMRVASELRAQYETEKLMERLEKKTNDFLDKTRIDREGTKLAAEADRNMEGKGIELGSWGNDEMGNTVATGFQSSSKSLSASGKATEEDGEWGEVISSSRENKVLFIADEKQEDAKILLPEICNLLEKVSVKTSIVSSLKPAPLGGFDSETLIFFVSSFLDRSSVSKMLDRVLSRTVIEPGKISRPPSHIICVSVLGTENPNTMSLFPFSIGNVMSGKITQKREMEEALISKCRARPDNMGFDYTVLKLGKIKPSIKTKFLLKPGDAATGDIDSQTAASVLLQTMAYQRSVRNSTFSVIGTADEFSQEQWNDLFLKLDGPELLRMSLPVKVEADSEDLLRAYIQNWAKTKFIDKSSGSTGLTTPVFLRTTKDGVQILFKQTNTGSAYKSKDEEKEFERQQQQSQPAPKSTPSSTKQKKEGGVQVIVERAFQHDHIRVRVQRCNTDFDTVVKEMSEEVIIKRLEEAVSYWIKQNQ